jgi:glycosyltransferase involved in cell wall biosynthesis
MMSVADLVALSARRLPPVLLYAHETQLAYPAPGAREGDLHFAFTDLTNMLAADRVAFNSVSHRAAFMGALPGFLRKLPEHRPMWAPETIGARSTVCHPGITFGSVPPSTSGTTGDDATSTADTYEDAAPLILWNHRWEFDKNPDAFFEVLRRVKRRGARFRLALLGENFQAVPTAFVAAREEFADEIVHYGYVAERETYEQWLSQADIVVSTAVQENFGISVMEAMAHGAVPLLPNRLSYPEILPREHHTLLYDSDDELAEKLFELIRRLGNADDRSAERERVARGLKEYARGFSWRERIHAFDALFEDVACSR